jgi:hypothetical protein
MADAAIGADDRATVDLEELLSFADELEKKETNSANDDADGSRGNDDPGDSSTSGFDSGEIELLSQIGQELSESMSYWLSEVELAEELSDEEHQEIMFTIIDKVLKAVKMKGNTDLDEEDLAFVRTRVEKEAIKRGLQRPAESTPRRFTPLDHVVCRVGGERGWAAGTVQALDQEDDAVDPYRVFAYVVKLDPPKSSGFSVAEDSHDCVRAEVCFGQRADALLWTLRCLPRAKARGSSGRRRFRVGERVACAVEAQDGDGEEMYAMGYSNWAAGTVSSVDHPVEGIDGVATGGVAAYLVALDGGSSVRVHKDEHWLVRDLALQPAGPRVAADGTRALTRIGKRKAQEGDDCWFEVFDHVTRNVRRRRQELENSDLEDVDD